MEGRSGKAPCFIYAFTPSKSAKTIGNEGMDGFSRRTLTWLNIMFFQVVRHGLACAYARQVVEGRSFHSVGKSPSMWAIHRIHFKGYSSSTVVGGLAREMCSMPEVCEQLFPEGLFIKPL